MTNFIASLVASPLNLTESAFAKLLSKKEKDIFFDKVCSQDFLTKEKSEDPPLYCYHRELCSSHILFMIGDMVDSNADSNNIIAFESNNLNNSLYLMFGRYGEYFKQLNLSPLADNKINSQKMLEEENILSECFDKQAQERFTMLYEQAKIEGETNGLFWINPNGYKDCKYLNFAYKDSLPINNGQLQFIVSRPNSAQIKLFIKKSDSGWDVLKKF